MNGLEFVLDALALGSVRDFLAGILHIADGFVSRTFGFVCLALGLKLLVAGRVTGRIFHGALRFVEGAFGMLFVNHWELLVASHLAHEPGLRKQVPT